jgi:circadian clock protein KaiB
MVPAAVSSVVKPKSRAKKEERRLRLYVAGNAPNSLRAIANAKAICEDHVSSAYQLEIVDLLQHPQRALADGIIVTPTLLRLSPLPVARVVGNLADTSQVLLLLGSK